MCVSSKVLSKLVLGMFICGVLTGCTESKITVKVNGDGTGHILVTRLFAKEMVSMFSHQMKMMTESMPAGSNISMPDDPFYNEKTIKAQAGDFGPGVEYVQSKKYDKNGGRGFVALYKFEDINKIFINLDSTMANDSMMAGMGGGMGGDELVVAEKEDDAFEFKLEGDDVKKLKIVVPSYPEPEEIDDDDESAEDEEMGGGAFSGPEGGQAMAQMMAMGNPFGLTGEESETEVMHRMMNGLGVTISVEVNAKQQKSNASFKRKTSKGGVRYILLDMDMGKVLLSEQGKKRMNPGFMNAGPGSDSGAAFFANLNGISGMTIQTNNVQVNFQ